MFDMLGTVLFKVSFFAHYSVTAPPSFIWLLPILDLFSSYLKAIPTYHYILETHPYIPLRIKELLEFIWSYTMYLVGSWKTKGNNYVSSRRFQRGCMQVHQQFRGLKKPYPAKYLECKFCFQEGLGGLWLTNIAFCTSIKTDFHKCPMISALTVSPDILSATICWKVMNLREYFLSHFSLAWWI